MSSTARTRSGRARLSGFLGSLLLLTVAAGLTPAVLRAAPETPSVVLITLDTTRADSVGPQLTPNLDRLARRGTRYSNAISPAPLTLPAHCSLLTGLAPPEHGVRDNGVGALAPELPTLASVLAARGYATGAFVSSRVLDHRFGLDRGFATYDDRMVAEQMGEQGYPERDGAAVTDAALAWAKKLPPGRPYFLWIHYYDPHAPYRPPGDWTGKTKAQRYAGEVAFMDAQIGRLLSALPETAGGRLVAAVGDHGEMLGEHGEKEHGILLYRGSLSVPLLLAGPRVPEGAEVRDLVGTRALAPTLLALSGAAEDAKPLGEALPGAGLPAKSPETVYSETFLPASSYGWSPMRSVTDRRFRYVEAPLPELYDLVADPGEAHNIVYKLPDETKRLRRIVLGVEAGAPAVPSARVDPELAASLRSLGYLSGSSPRREGGLDPKDGIEMLAEFDEAKREFRQGRRMEAVEKMERLVRRSPGNVPFLFRLGDAQMGVGLTDEGLRSLSFAVSLSPNLDFLLVRLAQAYAEAGRVAEATRAYRAALRLNPRSAPAWSGLAEIARRTEGPAAERKILEECESAGTRSASLLARLSELELAAGSTALGRRHAEEAARWSASVRAEAGKAEEDDGVSPVSTPRPRE